MRKVRCVMPALAALCVISTPLFTSAAVVTFKEDVAPTGTYASGIATVRSAGSTNTNFGSDNAVIAGVTTTDTLRGEFSFPVSSIPALTTVSSVTLTLVGGTNDATSTTSVSPVLVLLDSSFTESTVNYTNQPTFTTNTVLSTLTGLNPTVSFAGTTFTFPSTAAFVAAAQAAIDAGGSLNFVLKLPNDTPGTRNILNFVSDDPNASGAYTTANQPTLTITTVPEPTSLGLLGLASLPFLARRGRRRRGAGAA